MMELMKNNFEVIEEKGIKNTMLYVKGLCINEESYEAKILSEENIDNVIKFQIVYEGDGSFYRFDVSNTISFDEFIKSYKLKKNDICYIIDSIDNLLSTIENYLIEENSITLDLRLVRVSKILNNSFKLNFIILPNLKTSFSYELSKFLIRILRFVDIDDKNALKLAYGLFVKSSKDNYTINDLIELVNVVRDRNASILNDIDREALQDYDDEMVSEMQDVIIESDFRESMPELNEFIDAEKNMEEMVYQKNIKKNNDAHFMDDVDNMDIKIDPGTESILKSQLLENFDVEKAQPKVINFKKKLFNFKPKKTINAHIILGHRNTIFFPILCILVPLVFYFFYGADKFVSMVPFVCLCEVLIVTMFAIKSIMERSEK